MIVEILSAIRNADIPKNATGDLAPTGAPNRPEMLPFRSPGESTRRKASAASGKLAPGQLVIELCRGIRAFAKGDYEAAILAFEPLMPSITRIGGSHAQRELYEDTYIVACLRSGHPDKARQIISRRLDHRPSTNEPWLRQAQSMHS